jgi:hypothetical protein
MKAARIRSGSSMAGMRRRAAPAGCGADVRARNRRILLVDAGLPAGDARRFDLFGSSEEVEQTRGAAEGGYLPIWTTEDLREAIEDPPLRERFVAELTRP